MTRTILHSVRYNDPVDSFLEAVKAILAAAPVASSEIDILVAPDHFRDPIDPQTVLLVEERSPDGTKTYFVDIF